MDTSEARQLLEESAIYWRRDWDALFAGFILGVLCTLAMQRVLG